MSTLERLIKQFPNDEQLGEKVRLIHSIMTEKEKGKLQECYQDFETRPMSSFQEYQEFANTTKVFPEKHAVIYPALGLSGESGEIAEKVKKWLRGDGHLNVEEIKKELGDVLWYISAMCTDLNISLEEVVAANVLKLSKRKKENKLHGSGDNR